MRVGLDLLSHLVSTKKILNLYQNSLKTKQCQHQNNMQIESLNLHVAKVHVPATCGMRTVRLCAAALHSRHQVVMTTANRKHDDNTTITTRRRDQTTRRQRQVGVTTTKNERNTRGLFADTRGRFERTHMDADQHDQQMLTPATKRSMEKDAQMPPCVKIGQFASLRPPFEVAGVSRGAFSRIGREE